MPTPLPSEGWIRARAQYRTKPAQLQRSRFMDECRPEPGLGLLWWSGHALPFLICGLPASFPSCVAVASHSPICASVGSHMSHQQSEATGCHLLSQHLFGMPCHTDLRTLWGLLTATSQRSWGPGALALQNSAWGTRIKVPVVLPWEKQQLEGPATVGTYMGSPHQPAYPGRHLPPASSVNEEHNSWADAVDAFPAWTPLPLWF